MKILLINSPRPPNSLLDLDAAQLPPLALEYLAAELPPGAEVRIVDAVVDNLSTEQVAQAAQAFQPDWVGLTALTLPCISTALEIAGKIKSVQPGVSVVMGGTAACGVATNLLRSGHVDYIVYGEGEITLRELVSGLNPYEVEGISFSDQGRLIHTPARQNRSNLDTRAPARICDRTKYTAFGKRVDAIESSRGQPPDQWRARSAPSVVDEVARLVEQGAQLIMFLDDAFMYDLQRVRQICNGIVERQIRTLLWCFADLAALSQEPQTVARLRQAGFVAVLVTLKARDLRTAARRERISQAVSALHEADIGVWATLAIGGLEPDEPLLSELVDFMPQLDLEFVQFVFETPYPGTLLYDECMREGLLLSTNWTAYNPHRPVFRMDIAPEFADAALSKLYKSYYLREEFAEPRTWAKLRAEEPRLAKFLQLFNPAGVRTARDMVREGFLKSIWTRLVDSYCAPVNLDEWAKLFAVARQLVNSHLAQQFPLYSATIGLDMDIGCGYLKLTEGEIDALVLQDPTPDLVLRLDNQALRHLLISLTANPETTLAAAYVSGSPQALADLTRYLIAFQTYLRPWCHCGTPMEVV